MKKYIVLLCVIALALPTFAQDSAKVAKKEAVKSHLKQHFKPYGFIRNYAVMDTRESVYGTEDFFYYVPKDIKMVNGTDLNAQKTFAFAAITSRIGLDVTGYEVSGWNVGAKLEADFYAGVSGVTGTALFRLRQAYLTLGKNAVSFKIGQAWHPMAADMPHVFKRFWRADSSRSYQGNGLGLALVKAIVTSYGGSVTCESTPNDWTRFTVTLPEQTSN